MSVCLIMYHCVSSCLIVSHHVSFRVISHLVLVLSHVLLCPVSSIHPYNKNCKGLILGHKFKHLLIHSVSVKMRLASKMHRIFTFYVIILKTYLPPSYFKCIHASLMHIWTWNIGSMLFDFSENIHLLWRGALIARYLFKS